MRRVIEQRLSPQYVSVHATDLRVRSYLLGVDEKRADISAKMQQFLDAGIEVHAQVVLCPEINDGEILRRTIYDLAESHPRIKSVAIVPLGLTRYNTDPRLTRVTPEFCRRIIGEVDAMQKDLRGRLGSNFAFLGDEIYLRAGSAVPGREHYGDYPQIEDGIGMVRSFMNDISALRRKLERRIHKRPVPRLRGTVMTGTLFAPVMREQLELLNKTFETELHVVGVENKYFGGDVSVAGLLSGMDFLAARDSVRGDFAVIPHSVLKTGEEIMLDGISLTELKDQFRVPVHARDFKSLARMFD
jgi:putative radical SAM enzyme (TIGR03279 family)